MLFEELTESLSLSLDKIPSSCERVFMCVIVMRVKIGDLRSVLRWPNPGPDDRDFLSRPWSAKRQESMDEFPFKHAALVLSFLVFH